MNTRKTAKAVLATFGLSVLLPTAAMAAVDTQNHWAGSVMEKWEKQALLGGYEDGTIRPDGQITRAEFVALVNRAGGYQPAANAVTFSDVKAGDWYAGQVAAAVNQGYIGGFEDGTFRPNENITREQAAAIIARLHKLPSDPARAEKFADADNIAAWAKGVVGAVANAGYMVGDSNNNFNGAKAMTRAEAVSSLDRVFKIEDVKAEKLTISLSQPIGTINKGAVKTITVTASVKDAVIKATSSNPSVATVTVEGNKVIIRGLEKGSVTITITASAPGYQDAVVTSDSAVAIGGGGGGGGSTYVPPTTKPEVGVEVSNDLKEAVKADASNTVDNLTNSLSDESVNKNENGDIIGVKNNETSIAVYERVATTSTSASEKTIASEIAAYMRENPNQSDISKDTLDELGQRAIENKVNEESQELAEKMNTSIDEGEQTGSLEAIEVPPVLQEVASTLTITPNPANAGQTKIKVSGEYITLNEGALNDLGLTVAINGSGSSDATKTITVGMVMEWKDAGKVDLTDGAEEILRLKNTSGGSGEILAKGSLNYDNVTGLLTSNWSGISSLSGEEATKFMKNSNVSVN